MIRYRIRKSGEVVSKQQIKQLHSNTSLPSVWGESVYDSLGIDPVTFPQKPAPSGAHKVVIQGAPNQDSSGNWVGTWSERDMTSDESSDWDQAESDRVRSSRNRLLEATDHYGLSDVTMSEAMTTYRQALRDVPQQEGFPQTITWPTKPE